jgi:hypothetical protein
MSTMTIKLKTKNGGKNKKKSQFPLPGAPNVEVLFLLERDF